MHTSSIPHLDSSRLIVNGTPFIMIAGEAHNSSASSPAYMERVFAKAKSLNANTLIVPVTWELFEPQEGHFDSSLPCALIDQARAHEMRIVILWFGSWKNGCSSYVPEWVLRDTRRFPRAAYANGKPRDILSTLSEEGRRADAAAFAALMRFIRDKDARHHTVVAVQVENEVGILGDTRDRSDIATRAYGAEVPHALMKFLAAHKDALHPELVRRWGRGGFRAAGTWAEVFGEGTDSNEVFSVWHYATYVNAVAKAGKDEHPLPMFVNTWLPWPGGAPGNYPTGGPVEFMLDVWRAGAPDIDLFAPDIYLDDFKAICAQYVRNGNPLLVPEANNQSDLAGAAYWTFGHHHGLCYAPFGFESIPEGHPVTDAYALLNQLAPLIGERQGTERMRGFFNQKGELYDPAPFVMGHWKFQPKFIKGAEINGRSGFLLLQTGEDEFIAAGHGFLLMPVEAVTPGPPNFGILSVEMGHMDRGAFLCDLRLNGDETSANTGIHHPVNTPNLFINPTKPVMLRFRLYRYD